MSVQDLDAVVRLAEATGGAPTWSRLAYEAIFSPSSGLHRFAWTSRCEQSLSGFAVASWLPQEREADLETVVVDPRYRRQGQASALLRAVMLAAAQAGALAIRLEVRASNTAALALYHQNGFASIGIRRSYYSAPVEDALLLQRPL